MDPGSEVTLTGLASLPQRMGLLDGGFGSSFLPQAIVCLFGGGGVTEVRASLRTLVRSVEPCTRTFREPAEFRDALTEGRL